MIYSYINDQWSTLKTQSYSNDQEEQTLRDMQRATRKIIAVLQGCSARIVSRISVLLKEQWYLRREMIRIGQEIERRSASNDRVEI